MRLQGWYISGLRDGVMTIRVSPLWSRRQLRSRRFRADMAALGRRDERVRHVRIVRHIAGQPIPANVLAAHHRNGVRLVGFTPEELSQQPEAA